MQSKSKERIKARLRRKKHIRKIVNGSPERPRLVVYRSLKGIYAQIVDDSTGQVLMGLSSKSLPAPGDDAKGKVVVSAALGKALASRAKEKGIEKVVFDRNGYLYHGRVKAVAEGAREGGLIL
jgi:large subunit ribosomal protein L18